MWRGKNLPIIFFAPIIYSLGKILHTPAESGAGGDDNAAEEDKDPGKQEYVCEEDEDCGGHTTTDPPGV